MKPAQQSCLAAALLLTVSGVCHGVNWQWLNDAAVKSFTEQDWELLRSTARTALDRYPDGTRADWANPDNRHSGSIEVQNTRTDGSTKCRTAVFTNQAGKVTGSSRLDLCQQEDGSWKIPAASTATPAGQ